MLMGQTGLGKTHLSLAIANVAIGRGLSVEYGTAYNILSDLQNENFGRTGNLQYTEERVLHTDLLILDDLGTEYLCLYRGLPVQYHQHPHSLQSPHRHQHQPGL